MQDDIVKRIKETANIVNIIGEFVELKRAGRNYKGLCPFHKEKTPSFVVSEENQFFKCFGCGESGDVITFIMKRDNMDFKEALEYLADKLGITIENTLYNRRKKIETDKYYRINKMALQFFYEKLLTSSMPRNYLRSRKIDDKSINNFILGYAPDSWDMLYTHMMRKGVDPEDLITLGLVGISKNGNYYDRFRNRLIFPIIDIKKRIIGFGGRALDDDPAKYINSPESPIYHKGNNLYALNKVHSSNFREKILLVEGYMDVIGLHQRGVNYAVATLGTAMTQNQAKLIKRYGDSVYICYDSDNAGIKAANGAVEVFREIGVSPSVVLLEKGMDPDDYIKEYGKESFEKKLNNSLGYIDFQISLIIGQYDRSDPSQIEELIKKLSEYLNQFKSEVIRDEYIGKISERLNIRPESLRRDVDNYRSISMRNTTDYRTKSDKKRINLPRLLFECILYSVTNLEYYSELKHYLDMLDYYELTGIKEYINREYDNGCNSIDLEKMIVDPDFTEIEKKVITQLMKSKAVAFKSNSKVLIELVNRLDTEMLNYSKMKLKRDIGMLMSLSSEDMNEENTEKLQAMLNRLKDIEVELKTGKLSH
ncbi:MAG: DNA primase [Tissierellia bacterium]|nr:DNA primase [Tissierellia bacterium]